jgi:hypothetical protein
MSSPNPFPCGGVGQRPCPPTNAAAIQNLPTAHASAVLALLNEYGQQCYEKGLADGKA